MAGLETFILDTPHQIPCPRCGFTLDVALRQIRGSETIHCARCGESISLARSGSALGNIGNQVKNLEDVVDRLASAWRP